MRAATREAVELARAALEDREVGFLVPSTGPCGVCPENTHEQRLGQLDGLYRRRDAHVAVYRCTRHNEGAVRLLEAS